MLAVNGATFDRLVRAGLTAGQVDDGLARLGKRVHRTDIGWESRQVGGLVDFVIACYQDQAVSGHDGRPTCRSLNRRTGSSALAAASPAAPSPTAPATPPSANARCRTSSSRSPRMKSTWLRSGSNPTRSASPAPNSSDPPTQRSSSLQPLPATRIAPTTSSPRTRSSARLPQRRRRSIAARSTGPAAIRRRHRLRPPTQPAQLTKTDQSGRYPAGLLSVLHRTRQTQAASLVSPRPASTQTASRVRRYARASLRRIRRSGNWNHACTGNGSGSSRISVPRASSSSANGEPGSHDPNDDDP